MNKFVIAAVVALALALSVGCAHEKKKPTTHPYPLKEADAVDIAKVYLKEKKATAEGDEFYARPYGDADAGGASGWIVRVERTVDIDTFGRHATDPGSVRMLRIDPHGNVLEYLPGATPPPPAEKK
jgi:hypothetical protein